MNRYDEGVTLLAHQLHQVSPNMGRRKLADVLLRAGLQLGASTVRRLLKKQRPPTPSASPPPSDEADPRGKAKSEAGRVVSARAPHHVWHVDLTTHPVGQLGAGFWVPRWPFALVLRWVMSFHLALVVDHFSRALVAFAMFKKEPTAHELCAFLERAVGKVGCAPRYIVSDQGAQFQWEYREWRRKTGIRPRLVRLGSTARAR